MTPRFELEQTASFVRASLSGESPRLLDVGAGDGGLALELADLGFRVTPIDASEKAVSKAQQNGVRVLQADIRKFQTADRFEAVLFSLSAHHVKPFDQALDRVNEVLNPSGTLLLEEFDVAAIDIPTANWFYDAQGILHAVGAVPEKDPASDALESRRREHEHDGESLVTGEEMLSAVKARFDLVSVDRVPFLYRYLAKEVAKSLTKDFGAKFFELETSLIRQGRLKSLGLRIVARKK